MNKRGARNHYIESPLPDVLSDNRHLSVHFYDSFTWGCIIMFILISQIIILFLLIF